MSVTSALSRFSVNVRNNGFVAEIVGADIRNDPDGTCIEIGKAMHRHGVVVIRDQANLSPDAHIRFTERFGQPLVHLIDTAQLPGYPPILVLSNKKRDDGSAVGFEDAGRYWHSDMSYESEPPMGSLLHAIEIPEEGGDTLYCDMVAAYEALPKRLQVELASLEAVHSYATSFSHHPDLGRPELTAEQKGKIKEIAHPVVRVHPDSRKKALYVNPGFTSRFTHLSKEESAPLLDELFAHATQPEFVYRHVWQPSDLVFWDNQITMHHATPFDKSKYDRLMHRTPISGSAPIGPASEVGQD